jgi:hypothetical protein
VRRSFALGAGLFALSWLVFVANCRVVATLDSLPAAYLPFAIWNGDGLALDRFVGSSFPADTYSVARAGDGHWRSNYPFSTALAAFPFYVPALAALGEATRDPVAVARVAPILEKYAAATLAALAVLALFALLRRRTGERQAAALAAIFAVGTPLWAVGSQALWQHAPTALLLILGLRVAIASDTGEDRARGRSAGAGALLGLIASALVWVRPTSILFALGLGALGCRRGGRFLAGLAVVAVAGALGLVSLNLATTASWLGSYPWVASSWFAPSLARVAGVLASNRGLLFFSPFLPFLFFPRRPVGALARPERVVLGATWVAHTLLIGSFDGWAGGEHYGGRYVLEALPILFLLGARALERPWGRLRALAFGLAVAVAVGLQAIGAFFFLAGDSALAANRAETAWSWRRSVTHLSWNGGPAAPELFPLARLGSPDLLPPASRRAALELRSEVPPEILRLGAATVALRVTNLGDATFPAWGGFGGQGATRIQVLWWRETKLLHSAWFALGGPLAPGASRERTLVILAPRVRGDCRLEIVLAQATDEGPALLDADPRGVVSRPIRVLREPR